MSQSPKNVELLVCIKCRREDEAPEGEDRPGAILYEHLAETGIENVTISPVECLSNCKQGCTIALRGDGRWTYVYGRFDPESDAATIKDGATKYAATTDGLVPWRERPEHFRKNCIARLPPLTAPVPNLGEL